MTTKSNHPEAGDNDAAAASTQRSVPPLLPALTESDAPAIAGLGSRPLSSVSGW